MNIDEFEKSVDTLTVTNDFANTPWISNEIGVEHYGYENTKSDKPFVFSKGYPTFRLHYIVRGKLLLSVHGKNIHLKTGQCFLLRPDVNIGYKTDPLQPASFYWVSMSGNSCKTILSQLDFTENNSFVSVARPYRSALRRAFFANFREGEDIKSIRDCLFLENFLRIYQCLFLSLHMNNKASGQKNTGAKQISYVEKAVKYINEHFNDPELTIKEIARTMFLHENYLSHIFSEAMGQSFREFLTQKRIERSIVLMQKGMTSVKNISKEIGFSDALYFSKVFKKYNGISPTEHLKKLKTTTPLNNTSET